MRRDRGSVLIYSLVVLTALIGVLAAVSSTEHLDIKAGSNRKNLMKARMACMAAIQRYIAVEANDLSGLPATSGGATTATSTTAQTTGASTLQDDWSVMGQANGVNGDEHNILGDVTFRMQVVDACSFVNMNNIIPTNSAAAAGSSITPQMAPWLTNMPLSQQQIDAFVDFTTSGETPTADGGKDAYYNGLTNAYNATLAPLDTFDEMLQIRYFNAAALWEPNTNTISTVTYTPGQNSQQPTLYDLLTPYSYAPNVQPGPLGQQQPKINITPPVSAQAAQQLATLGLSQGTRTLLQSGAGNSGVRVTSIPSLLRLIGGNIQDERIILDDCTMTTSTRISGLINLNTASINVLSSVPNINPDVAQALVQQQQTGFTRLSDCLTVAGMTGSALTSTIQYFCVESDTFIVRVIGTCGDISVAMEATVDITNNTPRLIRLADVPFTDVVGRWNWNSSPSTDNIILEAS